MFLSPGEWERKEGLNSKGALVKFAKRRNWDIKNKTKTRIPAIWENYFLKLVPMTI